MPRSLNDKRKIVLIGHNIRSTHNVGSLFRTAEGLGVNKLILSGYSPYPKLDNDDRITHLANKIDKQIAKTSLGAEKSLVWSHSTDLDYEINRLKDNDYQIVALEQTNSSVDIQDYAPKTKIALIVGNELTGLEADILNLCDLAVEIPMLGKKESFNVVQAAAMALFFLRLSI